MGLQPSQPQHDNKKSQQLSNNYYGGQLMHNHQTNTTYQQFIIDDKYYDKFQSLIRSRQKLQHKNFITVKNHWKKNSSGETKFSCTNDKRIQVYVEYQALSQNLSKRLDKLSQSHKTLPQPQLLTIFKSILQCLLYLKSKSTCHGDIKPQSIYFDSLGQLKLMDSFFMNGGRTSYEIVMENPSSMSLLSPQQLSRLKDKQFDDMKMVYQNQMFSFGLTMYEAMTFEPAMECYDLEKLRIKKDFFVNKPQIMVSNGYSQQLVNIVMGLILNPAQTRMNSHQLFDILSQFSY